MKEEKIKLSHPAGKNAVSISVEKYEIMKKAILHGLAKNTALTHTELLHAVNDYFLKNKIKFDGKVEWYMESAKLNLEANKMIHWFKDGQKLLFQQGV